MDRVGQIGIEHAQTGAIVIRKRSVRRLSGRTRGQECSRRRGDWEHGRAPNAGMLEAKEVAKFVGQNRFQVEGLWICTQRWGSREYSAVSRGVDQYIRIHNFTHESRCRMIWHRLITNKISGGDSRERKHARCECGIVLIEANSVQSVSGIARRGVCNSLQGRE